MAAALPTVTRNKSVEHGWFGGISKVFGKSKGVSDVCKLVSDSCKLALVGNKEFDYMSPAVQDWTKGMQGLAVKTRGFMGIPYLLTVVDRLISSVEKAKGLSVQVARDALDVASTSAYAVGTLLLSGVLSRQLADTGAVLKIGVNGVDLEQGVSDLGKVKQHLANNDLSMEVRTGLEDHQTILGLKVAKFALAIIGGLGTFLTFVLGATLPAAVAVGVLVASLASVILSLKVARMEEMAPYTVKIA